MELIKKLEQKRAELEAIKREIAILEGDVYLANKDVINEAYHAKGSTYGTVHVNGLTVNTPKKVTWDQVKLADMYDKIKLGNENPEDYIKVSYDVSETKYNAWPEAIRAAFDEARTVQPGKVTIKLGDE